MGETYVRLSGPPVSRHLALVNLSVRHSCLGWFLFARTSADGTEVRGLILRRMLLLGRKCPLSAHTVLTPFQIDELLPTCRGSTLTSPSTVSPTPRQPGSRYVQTQIQDFAMISGFHARLHVSWVAVPSIQWHVLGTLKTGVGSLCVSSVPGNNQSYADRAGTAEGSVTSGAGGLCGGLGSAASEGGQILDSLEGIASPRLRRDRGRTFEWQCWGRVENGGIYVTGVWDFPVHF